MLAINENLKLLRQAKGMTQADVAETIAVTRQTISSYESGRTQPDLDTLKRLAEVYQADLHDVLYGGNRLQRKIKRIEHAAFILVSIMLLGLLTHSVLLMIMNTFFSVASGAADTPEIAAVVETRFILRSFAQTACGVCSAVFALGYIIILYPSVTVAKSIKINKLILLFLTVVAAILALTLPFGMTDRIFGVADYIFPAWNILIFLSLFFIVILLANVVKRHRSK